MNFFIETIFLFTIAIFYSLQFLLTVHQQFVASVPNSVEITVISGSEFHLTQKFHCLRIAMVEEAGRLRIQRCDRIQICGAQFKIENVEIFGNSFRPNGFWNRNDFSLN